MTTLHINDTMILASAVSAEARSIIIAKIGGVVVGSANDPF